MLWKRLATIKTDIPLDLELADFSVEQHKEKVLRKWCKKLDIKETSVFG